MSMACQQYSHFAHSARVFPSTGLPLSAKKLHEGDDAFRGFEKTGSNDQGATAYIDHQIHQHRRNPCQRSVHQLLCRTEARVVTER